MKEITLKVPDKKVKFFIKLISELGFELSEKSVISNEHKSIVRERIKSSSDNQLITWEEARKQLTYKSKA